MVNDKDKMVVTETQPMGTSVAPHGHEHEHSDIDIRALLISMGVLAAVVLATCLAMWGLFRLYESGAKQADPPLSPVADTVSAPPEPRLQAFPRKDMDEMRQQTDSLINGYGWADKPAGKVHIPIDRAIEIVAQRGVQRPQGTFAPADTTVAAPAAPATESATPAAGAPAAEGSESAEPASK